jgi:histidyl-tRNA synthetase
MQKGPPTPKGFRDIQPELAKKRREVINKIADVLEKEGFVPLETPTLEFAETLTGKYGEEEKLIYKFQDRGGRDLALRYDLTVPLARYVANNNPKLPFRRYQIGQVFRGENPQHGRYREFTQFDFDVVGSENSQEDALVIVAAAKSLEALGVNDYEILINDRMVFDKFVEDGYVNEKDLVSVLRSLDKIKKVGEDGVVQELESKGFSKKIAEGIIHNASTLQQNNRLLDIFSFIKNKGIKNNNYVFNPSLARGLDYYTSTIFEIEIKGHPGLSIGAGGRYDNLIGIFAQKQIPAVGVCFGLDRLVDIVGV